MSVGATHHLKCLHPYFDAVARGDKTFEVRLNDRDFQVGDTLKLVRYVDDKGDWEHIVKRRVTYVLHGGQFGIEPGYVVMGLEKVDA